MRPAHLVAALLLAAMLLLAAAPAARGVVIYDNFGPGDTFGTTGANTVSTFQNVAVRIMPSAAASATDVTVAMSGPVSGSVMLSVCADASGHPGTVLSSTSVMLTGGSTPTVYHATFASPVALAAGTTYWLRAAPGTGPTAGVSLWYPNSIGQFGGYSATTGTGSWVAGNGATPTLRLEDTSAPLAGACCAGSTCAVTAATACNALNTHFAGVGTSCNPPGNFTVPCCKADFNHDGGVTIQDLFSFLAAWFVNGGQADINGGGVTIQDIFDFLAAWFAGC